MQKRQDPSRRRHERVQVSAPVHLDGIDVTTRDISVEGVFLELDSGIAIGSEVSFSIELIAFDKKASFLCKGNVIRKEANGEKLGVGIQIANLTINSVN